MPVHYATGGNSALIVSFYFQDFVYAAALMRASSQWSGSPDAAYQRFLAATIEPLATETLYSETPAEAQNHADVGMRLSSAVHAYLSDTAGLDSDFVAWSADVPPQIVPDSLVLPREVCRNNAVVTPPSPVPPGFNPYCSGPAEGSNGLYYASVVVSAFAMTAETFQVAGRQGWSPPISPLVTIAYDSTARWVGNETTFPFYAQLQRNGYTLLEPFLIGAALLQQRVPTPAGAAYLATLAPAKLNGDFLTLGFLYSIP
jgi:hypothetical protein